MHPPGEDRPPASPSSGDSVDEPTLTRILQQGLRVTLDHQRQAPQLDLLPGEDRLLLTQGEPHFVCPKMPNRLEIRTTLSQFSKCRLRRAVAMCPSSSKNDR